MRFEKAILPLLHAHKDRPAELVREGCDVLGEFEEVRRVDLTFEVEFGVLVCGANDRELVRHRDWDGDATHGFFPFSLVMSSSTLGSGLLHAALR